MFTKLVKLWNKVAEAVHKFFFDESRSKSRTVTDADLDNHDVHLERVTKKAQAARKELEEYFDLNARVRDRLNVEMRELLQRQDNAAYQLARAEALEDILKQL